MSTPPLNGIRVIALEEYGVGLFASQLFADLGADVIKIENPDRGSDSSRHIPPHQVGSDSLYFESLNRGKRSITLDMKSDAARRVFRELVVDAHAVDTPRPGTCRPAPPSNGRRCHAIPPSRRPSSSRPRMATSW